MGDISAQIYTTTQEETIQNVYTLLHTVQLECMIIPVD